MTYGWNAEESIRADLFRKNFLETRKKTKTILYTFRKQNNNQKLYYLSAQKVKFPTVSAENIARNTFQQTVRTYKNSRKDNNWSSLSKEDGSTKGKNLRTRNRNQMSRHTSIYKRDNVHQPAFPL